MIEPQDPVMRHMFDYIRRNEKDMDGVEHNSIVMDAHRSYPDMPLRCVDATLMSLYIQGYIERRYDGRYEIPEN